MRLWPVNQAFSVAIGPDPSSHVAPVHALLHAPIRVTSATMSYNVSAEALITSEWEMVSVPTVTYGRIAFVVGRGVPTDTKLPMRLCLQYQHPIIRSITVVGW